MSTSPVPLFFLTLQGRTWFNRSYTSTEHDRTDWGTPVNWSGSWWSSSAEETSGCRTRRASSPRARARAGDRGKASLEKAREKKSEEVRPDLITKDSTTRGCSASKDKKAMVICTGPQADTNEEGNPRFCKTAWKHLHRMSMRDLEIQSMKPNINQYDIEQY